MTCEFKGCNESKFPGALPYCSFHTELTLWWDLLVRLTNDQDICIHNPLGMIVSPSYIYRLDSIDNSDSLDPDSFDISNLESYIEDYIDEYKEEIQNAYTSISAPNIFQLDSFYTPPINVTRKIEVVMMSVFQQLVHVTIAELKSELGVLDEHDVDELIEELGGYEKLVELYKPYHINYRTFGPKWFHVEEYLEDHFEKTEENHDVDDIAIALNKYMMRPLIPKYIERFNRVSPVPFSSPSDRYNHFYDYHEYNYKRFIG